MSFDEAFDDGQSQSCAVSFRCKELVEEFLSVMGIQLLIESRFEYARVYPPSSEIPGIKEAEENAWSGSLRQRLGQNEVALVLIVRSQYEKALREGKIDEQGYALDSIESISIAMKNLLGRALPDKITERKKLFLRLRQLRLIEYRSDEAFENGEGWIKIHPMIVTFVSNNVIEALAPKVAESAEQEAEQNATPDEVEVIEVRGAIQRTMTRSLSEKKHNTAIVDAVAAADFGELPGLSLSDVIENISVTGVAISSVDVNKFKVGDELSLEFALDDEYGTEIKKEAIVRSVRQSIIGCDFEKPEDDFGSKLGYYITHEYF